MISEPITHAFLLKELRLRPSSCLTKQFEL